MKKVCPKQFVIFKLKQIIEDNIVTSRPDRTELILFLLFPALNMH